MEISEYLKKKLPQELYDQIKDDLKTLLDEYKTTIEKETLNLIAGYWTIEDVLTVNPLYSKEEALKILNSLNNHSDRKRGITWDTLESVCYQYGESESYYPLLKDILSNIINSPSPDFELLLDKVADNLLMYRNEVLPLLAVYRTCNIVPSKLLELIKKILNEIV